MAGWESIFDIDNSGSVDWGDVEAFFTGSGDILGVPTDALLSLLGGLLAAENMGKGPQPVGYQGKIPRYTAVRKTVDPYFNEERRPGETGQRYFTDTFYATEEDLPAALQAATEQKQYLRALNEAVNEQQQPLLDAIENLYYDYEQPRNSFSEAYQQAYQDYINSGGGGSGWNPGGGGGTGGGGTGGGGTGGGGTGGGDTGGSGTGDTGGGSGSNGDTGNNGTDGGGTDTGGTTPPTGGIGPVDNPKIADAINANPDILEKYWEENPAALAEAVNAFPELFGVGTGVPADAGQGGLGPVDNEKIASAIEENPQVLVDYWKENPDSLGEVFGIDYEIFVNNPESFGIPEASMQPGGIFGSPEAAYSFYVKIPPEDRDQLFTPDGQFRLDIAESYNNGGLGGTSLMGAQTNARILEILGIPMEAQTPSADFLVFGDTPENRTEQSAYDANKEAQIADWISSLVDVPNSSVGTTGGDSGQDYAVAEPPPEASFLGEPVTESPPYVDEGWSTLPYEIPENNVVDLGGNTKIAEAINNNPSILEDYWANNPDALAEVFAKSPDLFIPKETINVPKSSFWFNPSGISKFAGGGPIMGGIGGLMQQYMRGPHDGMADTIPARIDGQQEARLSGGEFVIPADVVSHLGNGNSDAGARQLQDMLSRVRKERTGRPTQGRQINPKKVLPR